MKRLFAAFSPGFTALMIAIAWVLFAQFLAILAWDAGLITQGSAVVHWLLVGVLPPTLALASMKPSR